MPAVSGDMNADVAIQPLSEANSLPADFDDEAEDEVETAASDLAVAPSYVAFGESDSQRNWRVNAGEVAIRSLPNGQMLVSLTGLQIVELIGAREGDPQPIADGYVMGEVERVCLEYVVLDDVPVDTETGEPAPQPQRDEDWSSPYCAQFVR